MLVPSSSNKMMYTAVPLQRIDGASNPLLVNSLAQSANRTHARLRRAPQTTWKWTIPA